MPRTLLDLATCCSEEELGQAFRTALRKGLTDRSELRAVLERYPRHAGGPTLRALLDAG